ncbi:Kunitz/Bovine pancreatic trypsin inhibitor domain protein, partial [Ostertagia ostertagi]
MPSPLCVFLLLNGAALADFLVKPRVVASVNYDDYSLLCADGIPLLMEDHRPRPCQPRPWLPEHKCPASFWCHEGDDESSYYCCPRNRKCRFFLPSEYATLYAYHDGLHTLLEQALNRCHLLPLTGHGNLTMRRFYYDWTSDGCHELHYTGIGGNENSFMTYEECEDACRGAGEPSVNPSDGSKISKNKKITKKPSTTTTTTPVPSSQVASVEPVTVPSIDNSEQPSTSKSAENSHETVQ